MAEVAVPGLRVGLEVHQQLATRTKLFCSCPPAKSESLPYSFERRLRPAQSETGGVDPAALFEFSKGGPITYLWSPESACLVDADEEPPHAASEEAIDTAVQVSLLLHSSLVDEVHVMRKMVIDGSNPSGFQRTAVVGLGGWLEVDGVRVGVQSVTLEEDAARVAGERGQARTFALDRVGVPLVEVALDPVTGTPEFVGAVAQHLGRALRSTGRVARGLGTIRQDLNVSLAGGAVVEVKGVQKLNLVAKVVAYEASRQAGLREAAGRVGRHGGRPGRTEIFDVSSELGSTGSKVLKKALAEGGIVVCVRAAGLAGLLGWEPSPGVRLGKGVAQVARANSLGGVIHSDEFLAQGVAPGEERLLRKKCGAGPEDGLVLLGGPAADVSRAAAAVAEWLRLAAEGVPAETRGATEDGETVYMRPRPGAQRMYPETDVPQILLTPARILRASKSMPEAWEKTVAGYEKRYGVSRDLALRLYDSDSAQVFESLTEELQVEPSVIASTLVELPVRLSREGVSDEALTEGRLVEVLREVGSGRLAKEAAPDVLRTVGEGKAGTVAAAVRLLGLRSMSEEEVKAVIDEVVAGHPEVVGEKGDRAFSALMGEVMGRVRGRADGKVVGALLSRKLSSVRAG